MPGTFSGTQYFQQDPNVVAQLVASNGLCLASVFPAAAANDGANFKATTTAAPGRIGEYSAAGNYAVGRRSNVFVDSTRPTMVNGSYPGAATRTLETTIWYPAESAGTGTPAAPGGPFPVVLIAHGFTSQRHEHWGLAEHLASHGFIAVAPNFPLSSVFSPGGATDRDLVEQAGDVTFVLESVVALGVTPLDGLFGKVDGDSRAVVGHSLGGQTVMIDGYDKVRADPAIDAVVAMGHLSCHQLESYYDDGPPLMIVGGSADAVVPYAQHAAGVPSGAHPETAGYAPGRHSRGVHGRFDRAGPGRLG